ncbi:drug/metabolite exporter YedA [Steroidobacter agaridevorans]|uniref:Drug/metabolite exporter YedA n=1 Tax=Steroidobacter agaridevorans TaxID=2695856 RepID=A0A829YC93_9GAMM|nr:EamA family transporter [Steroidobacter agaridevorans]GFE81014.1 drug/metabolite exporter YedA [Steroidobacter agaridevorans]GFE89102.1 drug/metabolite exporter YedA [Steroidobacter agaridevorans]
MSSASTTRLSAGMLAAFAAIYFFWGTTYLAIAVAIREIPPFISGSMRFMLAGLAMYVWLRWRESKPLANVDLKMAALAGVLLTGVGNGFVVWAQQGIPSGIAALIVTAVPVIVLLLDWAFFSKRAPTRQALIGTTVAVIGVVTIVTHTRSLSGEAHPLYLASLLLATVGWSFGTLIQKRAVQPGAVLSFTCAQMLFGGVFQLFMSVVDGEWSHFDPSIITWSSLAAVAYLVVFGSIVGLNCYLWLLTKVAAPKVATYALVNPVVALLLGTIVLNETLTPLVIMATVLVLAGVGLVLFQDVLKPSRLRSFVSRRAPAVAPGE